MVTGWFGGDLDATSEFDLGQTINDGSISSEVFTTNQGTTGLLETVQGGQKQYDVPLGHYGMLINCLKCFGCWYLPIKLGSFHRGTLHPLQDTGQRNSTRHKHTN